MSRIRLTSSGGLGNLPSAAEFPGDLLGSDLPEELARRMEQILERGDLPELGSADETTGDITLRGAPSPFGAADLLQYKLTVETEDGETRRFAFDELSVPPEVLDLVDDIKAEMLRYRQAAEEE